LAVVMIVEYVVLDALHVHSYSVKISKRSMVRIV